MGILSRLANAGLSHADDALRSSADEAGDAVRAMLRESPVIRAYHGSPRPPYLDMVAERLSEARSDPQHAMLVEHLLDNTDTSPQDWRRINEFLKDHRLSLGDTLGSGEERVVFDAIPASGDRRYVFKVGYSQEPFDVPDIPGVVPYVAMGQEGGVTFGVQPRAAAVYGHDAPWEPWELKAREVDSSLSARGWGWLDSDAGNVGLMPDGNFGVIDGSVKLIRNGFVPNSRARTPEEAIRILRHTGDMPRLR